MTNLISGKEAFDKAYDGELVEYLVIGCSNWRDINKEDWCDFNKEDWGVSDLKSGNYKFRLKPRTITINGIEVPEPFEPEERELFYHIYPEYEKGYAASVAHERNKTTWQQFGAWRTEEEIKQVIAAHRQVFDVKTK